jgi:hypothetical protein
VAGLDRAEDARALWTADRHRVGSARWPAVSGRLVAGATLAARGHMTEGALAVFEPFESGYDPGDAADQPMMATRNEVFPLHGLAPW